MSLRRGTDSECNSGQQRDNRGLNVEWERPKRPNRAKRQTHKRLDGFICPVSCPCPSVRLCPCCPIQHYSMPIGPLIVATLPCYCSRRLRQCLLAHSSRWSVEPFGLFRLFRPSLPQTSFSLSRWDTTDKHRHPRQGQYTGQSIVLSVFEIFWWKVWWSQCPTSVL